jgi:hypothetical protein
LCDCSEVTGKFELKSYFECKNLVFFVFFLKRGSNNCLEEHCVNSAKESANVSAAPEELLCSLER